MICETLFAVLVSVTVAFATTAPDWSVTTPLTAPVVVVCANDIVALTDKAVTARMDDRCFTAYLLEKDEGERPFIAKT